MNTDDPELPRTLTITITDDNGDWDVRISRNRVHAADDDQCDMMRVLADTVLDLHQTAHTAHELQKRRN